jgi:hypothetical protein
LHVPLSSESSSRRSRALTAFLCVPLVAAATWYLLVLVYLLIANGRLRLRTDVMAMAIGAVILGIPVAALLTVTLAVPAYLVVRRTVGVTAGSAVAGGAGIGLAAALVTWSLSGETSLISPLRGLLIGTVSGAAWWRLAAWDDGTR